MSLPRCLTLAWIAAFGYGQAVALDTVELSTAAGARTRLTGTVLEYTGRQLVLELPGGRRQEISGDRVLRVLTDYDRQQVEADRLLEKGELAQALSLYRQALAAESRAWVKRLILAGMVRCLQGLGQVQPAGDTFLALVASDPSTPYFDCIPLAWIPTEPSPLLAQTAEGWLGRDEEQAPAAVLLGASHLLPTARRPAALVKLRRLSTGADRRIGQLALAQTWRAEAQPGDDQLAAWQRAVEQMDGPLRAGPYFVLGQAYLQRQQAEEAALALLRIPILYPQHRDLAARALLDAGRALERLNRADQATRLYREVLGTYPGSPAAAEAQSRADQTTKPP